MPTSAIFSSRGRAASVDWIPRSWYDSGNGLSPPPARRTSFHVLADKTNPRDLPAGRTRAHRTNPSAPAAPGAERTRSRTNPEPNEPGRRARRPVVVARVKRTQASLEFQRVSDFRRLRCASSDGARSLVGEGRGAQGWGGGGGSLRCSPAWTPLRDGAVIFELPLAGCLTQHGAQQGRPWRADEVDAIARRPYPSAQGECHGRRKPGP
jgi:hypothetical protein